MPAAALFALGLDLMAEAEAMPAGGEIEAALAFRDGLMVALLATRPLRQRNLLAIEIGRHLLQVGEGWLLAFEDKETKTRRPLEFTVPQALHAPLDRYLRHWRPLLLAIGRRRHPDGRGRAAGDGRPGTGSGSPSTAPPSAPGRSRRRWRIAPGHASGGW